MSSPTPSDPDSEATPPAPARKVITEANFEGTPQSISDFAGRPDFPQCALGVYLDFQGFAGVVVEIVKDSIRVRPPEGITQRFNVHRLKSLHAPSIRPEPVAMREASPTEPVVAAAPATPQPEAPPRVYIAEPDFTAPVRTIHEYAGQPDFPKCVYGKHVDIQGYAGVVVEIVKGSLKIQSAEGKTRSYNAEGMKKLYGKA
jgi:hypothetical protein